MLTTTEEQLDIARVERLYWLGVEKRVVELLKQLRRERAALPADMPERFIASWDAADWHLGNAMLRCTEVLAGL